VIAGELAAGRLGFYFARPLAWWEIWAGKLVSSILLAVVATVLVVAPILLVRRFNPFAHGDGWLIPCLLAALLLVFGAAHAATIAWRSRSRVLLLDFGLLVASAVVIRYTWARLDQVGFVPFLFPLWTIVLLMGVGAVLFLVGGALQLKLGRTDLQRGHRVLSLAFWTPAFAMLTGLALFAWWAVNPSMGDLVRCDVVSAAPGGSWVAASGPVHGRGPYMSTFLADTATGHSVPVGPHSVAFSADGTRAAWLETAVSFFDEREVRLWTIDLSAPRPEASSIATTVDPRFAIRASLVFSPDRDRVLVITPASLGLFALGIGQSVAAVSPPPGSDFESAAFDGPQTIRAVAVRAGADFWQPRSLELVTVRLPGPTVAVTGRIESPGSRWLRRDGSGRLMLVREKDRRVRIFDGGSGEALAEIPARPDAFPVDASFLADGRVAVAEGLPSGVQVRLFGPDGREQASAALGRARSVRLGGEPAPGRLAVVLETSPFGPSDVALVDTGTLRLVRVEKGLAPVRARFFPEFASPLAAGNPGASLFTDENGALVRLDPGSGGRRMILPAAPRGGR
jgi:hypothetical protein